MPEPRSARRAVVAVFALNGFSFASWVSRIPQARDSLDLTPGQLGTLLLAISVGSVLALPTAGFWVARFGTRRVVATSALVNAAGLAVVAVAVTGAMPGVSGGPWPTAVGLFAFGVGIGTWDVAMNVEAAAVERGYGRTLMPSFHAAFSVGTVVGAVLGAAAAGPGASIAAHLLTVAAVTALLPLLALRSFLPTGRRAPAAAGSDLATGQPMHDHRPSSLSAWREPRTLAIGVMVFAMALTEGVANDWLAVALIDGYGVETWVAGAGFALFVAAMTVGRLLGGRVLDRHGRVPVLHASMGLAAAGVLLVVLAPAGPLVAVGIVAWGLGASLGFPVGMSAAADDPVHASVRVSVVSTIGYTAFLAGPPALGYLGDHVGVLQALLLVAVLLVPSALAVPAAAPQRGPAQPAPLGGA